MQRWLQVARVGEIADRDWKVISIKGADIALFNVNGRYFAVDETLTHPRGVPSADALQGGCVMNSWRTSDTGAAYGAARQKHTYEAARTLPVRVREGIIEVCEETG